MRNKCPVPNDPVELYMQLYEIAVQLSYLGEKGLQAEVSRRLEDIYDFNMDAQDHKELAQALYNLEGG